MFWLLWFGDLLWMCWSVLSDVCPQMATISAHQANMQQLVNGDCLKKTLNSFSSESAVDIDVCAKPTSTARVSKVKESVSKFLSELKDVR